MDIEAKFFSLISTQSKFCTKHKITFDEQTRKAPGGRILIIGCQQCIEDKQRVERAQDQKQWQDNISKGLKYDYVKRKWYQPETDVTSYETSFQKPKTINFRD